jgi:hypothetical protein
VYIAVTIQQTPSTPQDIVTLIKQAVYNDFNGNDLNSGNLRRGCGDIIYASSFSVALIKSAGVTDLESISIGKAYPPSSNSIIMDADEEPVLDMDNITVTMLDE